MFGFFGDIFDFDGDGKLDAFESAVDYAAFDMLMKEKKTELESMGISGNDIENMDKDELRDVIEDLGLDPDDYDL